MTAWLQDFMYAFRRVLRSRGLTAAAVLSIALGIAANATIFSMVSTFVLRPAPVGDPGTLVSVYSMQHGECCNDSFSSPLFDDLRTQARSLSGVAAYFPLVPASIGGRGEPERIWGQLATTNYFDVSQLHMTLGRGFTSDEQHLPVVVLSHGLWQRRFAADPGIVGEAITLSGHPYTVVGVAPPLFRGLDLILDAEFWAPLGNIDQLMPNMRTGGDRTSRGMSWLTVVGRLKPGVTRMASTAELNVISQRLGKAYPATDKERSFRLESAGSLPPEISNCGDRISRRTHGGCSARALHRLRECGQSASGAGCGTAARDGGASGSGRHVR